MRKFLLLAVIASFTSAAGAAISMTPNGALPGLSLDQTLTISISDDSGSQAGALMYIVVEEGGSGALSNPIELPAAGNNAVTGPITLPGLGTGYELSSGSTVFDLVPGVHFMVDYSGYIIGTTAVISLWDGYGDFSAPIDSLTIFVPEPTTIALLALAGILVRRRK